MDGHHEETSVPADIACPWCGEHDAEWLLRQDEHTVECQMCGVQFVACSHAQSQVDSTSDSSGRHAESCSD